VIVLPRINKKLFQELQRKTGKRKSRIYQMIDEKRREYGYTIPRETAASLLAAEMGIDISKFLNNKELEEVRSLIQSSKILPLTRGNSRLHIELPQKAIGKRKRELLVEGFNLPNKIANDAEKMSNVYTMIYILENALRYLLVNILEKKYGKNWWESKVSSNIKRKVESRVNQEKENRWHSKRGAHKIFYTNFGDLNLILVNNWKDFEDIFPDQTWIQSRLSEIELSRNIIAHNNPLPNREIRRIEIYFEDIKKQLRKNSG